MPSTMMRATWQSITDIVKRVNQIFIASSAQRNIRVVNAETRSWAVLTAPGVPRLRTLSDECIPDTGFRKSNILTTSGTIYSLATLEFIILKNTALLDLLPCRPPSYLISIPV